MGNFRWLQFSDLHLNPEEENFKTQMAWDALLDCVRKEDFGKRDDLYVFITGDIFNKGRFEEEESKTQQIKDFLKALGVRKERVFWAAGNHDMKRTTGKDIIQDLRAEKYNLDELRKDKEKDEYNQTKYQLLTRQRMFYYKKYYDLFFGKKLEGEALDRIHQRYVFEDFNLIVLNTSFTSFNDDDPRKIFISSKELYDVFEKIKKEKPVFVIGHHGKDYWYPQDKSDLETLFDLNVDVYLCGHEHAPGISQFDNCKREIKQFTCGGGVIDGHSIFNFYYGSYDSSKYAIKIVPYVYQRTHEWKEDFGGISREFEKGKLYYFQRLIDLDRSCSSKENADKKTAELRMTEKGRYGTWDLNCQVWRIPNVWDPDTEDVVPIDDKFAIPLFVQLIADRGRYAVFLAGDEMKGLLDVLTCQEEKYDTCNETAGQRWKKRIWKEYKGNETWEEIAEGMYGILISLEAESVSLQELKMILRKWNEKGDDTALVIHIWADNPCNAVICAQRAALMLGEIFSVPVLFKAEMGEVNKCETVMAEIDRKIERYNQEKFSREEEIRDLLRYRDKHPENWYLLLKKHALQRKGKGWICGYEAAYKVHEHAQVWISVADLQRFFEEGELAPYLFRLSKIKTDILTWEISLLHMRLPTDISENLLDQLREKASESIKVLTEIRIRPREWKGLFGELDYEEIARWARQADREDYEYAFSALTDDGIRRWILMISCVYGLDNIMEILTDPVSQTEAQLILNQTFKFTEDVVLKDETDYIRYLVHNER